MSGGRRFATLWALAVAAATFLGVAPFSCSGNGWCHGFAAFDYGPASPGIWQSFGTAALLGGVVWLLVWLAVSPERTTPLGARAVVSLLLVAGAGISLLSHSLLVVAGPLVAGLFLWLIWTRRPDRRALFNTAVLVALVAIAALYLLFPVQALVECSAGCDVVSRRSAAGLEVPRSFTYLVPVLSVAGAALVYRRRT